MYLLASYLHRYLFSDKNKITNTNMTITMQSHIGIVIET